MRIKNPFSKIIRYMFFIVCMLSLLISCGQEVKDTYVDITTLPEIEWEQTEGIVQNPVRFSNTTNEASVQVLNHLDNTSFHFYNGLAINSEKTMAMVGGTGLRVRITHNAGKSWDEFRFSRFANPFYASSFVGDTLYVAGESKYIFKTEDLGKSWSVFDTSIQFEQQPYAQFKYYKIKFLNNKLGFVVGEYMNTPIILKTNDGGANWTRMKLDAYPENEGGITDLQILSEQALILVTRMGNAYRMKDGGTSWELFYTAKEKKTIYFNSVAFTNAQNGFMGGIGGLLQTKDGGKTWQEVSLPGVKMDDTNVSDLAVHKKHLFVTTAKSFSDEEPEAFVFRMNMKNDSIQPYLTKEDPAVNFVGESYEIEIFNDKIYILDRNSLYQTKLK